LVTGYVVGGVLGGGVAGGSSRYGLAGFGDRELATMRKRLARLRTNATST
jgi:hypothetical protein